VVSRNCGLACATRAYHIKKALSLFEKWPLSSEVRSWRLHRHTTLTPAELARWIDPIVRGWMSYYGRFYRSAPYPLRRTNHYMTR